MGKVGRKKVLSEIEKVEHIVQRISSLKGSIDRCLGAEAFTDLVKKMKDLEERLKMEAETLPEKF